MHTFGIDFKAYNVMLCNPKTIGFYEDRQFSPSVVGGVPDKTHS